ncbi:hypothetical protein OIU91_06130 [Streptomyces sp. NBC_01456]|uniref:hypothetical protein n=1 Tax=Streptomyces sp. NBC_01456 TaxID=2975868 RepID=UPI002E2F0BAE|nr:hypothetical protein [Streptomyces sp. NBC_01456]
MKRDRECCDYCMWLGPVNKDGTMRKHRPATRDDKWGHPNSVQDMDAAPCPGSNKPYARFGTAEEATEDAQETIVTETAEYQPSRDAAIGAARTALAELKDKGWKSNPVYWVGRLEAALEQTLKAIDKAEGAKAQETDADDVTETAPKTGCKVHRVEDRRGCQAIELGTIPTCESGVAYGAWSEGAGGFVYSGDCATQVANWAADELRQLGKEDETDKIEVLVVCHEHEEQPAVGCEECATEPTDEGEADDDE